MLILGFFRISIKQKFEIYTQELIFIILLLTLYIIRIFY